MRTKAPYRTDTATTVTDARTALSLLPGQLLAKRRLEEEAEQIRAAVRDGKNREWIALLPGIEMQLEAINKGLAALGLGGNGHHQEVPQRALEAPKEARGSGGAVEISSLFKRTTGVNGKPVLIILLIREFMENDGLLDVKKFEEKWEGTYALEDSTLLSANMTRLRDRGLKVRKVSNGVYKLLTPLKGDLPVIEGQEPVEEAVAAPEPAPVAAPALAESGGGLFPGSTREILLRELEAGGGRVNTHDLAKKYGYEGRVKTGRFTFNFAMAELKKLGYRFERVEKERGGFRLVSGPKKGKK